MVSKLKRALRNYLARSSVGYRWLLKRDFGVEAPCARPHAPWHNAVLRSVAERDAAIQQVKNLGLPLSTDSPKNWDSLAALDCILEHTGKDSRILDAGAELYSVVLPWLFLYGYRNLTGNNLVFQENVRRGRILYEHGDITRTRFSSGTFDAITCMSVVEHGVDLQAYFQEMARVLKPGGILITSTDYWESPLNTEGKTAYGVPVHVLSRIEIEAAIAAAAGVGLRLTGPLDLECEQKVVHWSNQDLWYTFVVFTMKKMEAMGHPSQSQ